MSLVPGLGLKEEKRQEVSQATQHTGWQEGQGRLYTLQRENWPVHSGGDGSMHRGNKEGGAGGQGGWYEAQVKEWHLKGPQD